MWVALWWPFVGSFRCKGITVKKKGYVSMKGQKRQRVMMAVLAGVMAVLMLLPIVANIFVH